jgi:hypothetical protein
MNGRERLVGGAWWLVALAALGMGLWLDLQPPPAPRADDPAGHDLELYRAEVQRIRAGESYYTAAGAELRARHFPSASVLNWRWPTLMVLVAHWPGPDEGRLLLAGLALLTLILTVRAVAAVDGPNVALGTAVWLALAVVPIGLGNTILFHELWAGWLILLAAVLRIGERVAASWIVTASALALRELVAPFAGWLLLVALLRQHWREAAAWAGLLALFALGWWLHAQQVTAGLTSADRAQPSGWVQWGGVPFVLRTTQMQLVLLSLPFAVTGAYLAVVGRGLASWVGPWQWYLAAPVAAYLLGFLAVGQAVNVYWGLLLTPALSVAAGRGLVQWWPRTQQPSSAVA